MGFIPVGELRFCMPRGQNKKAVNFNFETYVRHQKEESRPNNFIGIWQIGRWSVQFRPSVVSSSLWPHGLQHSRLPCPSLTPGTYSNSCSLSQWCHPTISSSVIPCSSCLQPFPASGSFPMSQFFASGGQSIGVSASTSVLPMNILDWFPLGLTGLFSLHQQTFKSLLRHHSSKASILWHSAFFIVQLPLSVRIGKCDLEILVHCNMMLGNHINSVKFHFLN